MVYRCCVSSCRKSLQGGLKVSYHRFPNEETARKRWLNALNIDEGQLIKNKDLKVCSRHFDPDDYIFGGNIKKLKKIAVPKLEYPRTKQSLPSDNCETIDVKPIIPAPQEFCRLCSKQHQVYHSLFETEGSQMLESLTSMKVNIDDPAPNFACSECFSDLSEAYNIQQKFIAVERSHQNKLTIVEHVPVKEEPIDSGDDQCNSNIQTDAVPESSEPVKKAENNEINVPLIKCRICLEEVPIDLYRAHREAHSKCSFCPKEILPGQYRAHIKTHRNGFCEYCGAKLKNIECLRKHVSINHLEPKRHCAKCNLQFNNLNSYKLHVMRVHIGKASYVCETCGRQFFTTPALKKHIRIKHVGLDQFPCEVCGKKYQKKHLERHKKAVHNGEKAFICEFCGRGFTFICNMNMHKTKIHGWKDAANYKCGTCGKGYSTSLALSHHMRIHMKNMMEKEKSE